MNDNGKPQSDIAQQDEEAHELIKQLNLLKTVDCRITPEHVARRFRELLDDTGEHRLAAAARVRPVARPRPAILVAPFVIALVLLWAATVLVAHTGGPKLLGELTLLRILPGLIGLLVGCGLPNAALFFLARRPRDEARLRTTIVLLTLTGSLAACVCWLMMSPLIHRFFFHQWHTGIVLGVAVLAFTPLWVATGRSVLIVERDTHGANWSTVAEEAVFLSVYVGLLPIMHGTSLLMTALVSAQVLAILGIAVRLARRGYMHGWGRPDLGLAKEICRYGIRGHVGGMLSLINPRLDVVILCALAGPGTLGIYAVAFKFADMLRLCGLAVTHDLYPRMVMQNPKEATQTVAALLPRALVLTVLAALPLAAAVLLVPDVYGRAFATAMLPAWILLFGFVGEGATSPLSAYFYAARWRGAKSLALGVSMVMIVLDVTLIPRYHAVGAAAASAVTYLISSAALVACYFVVRKRAPRPRSGMVVDPAVAAAKEQWERWITDPGYQVSAGVHEYDLAGLAVTTYLGTGSGVVR